MAEDSQDKSQKTEEPTAKKLEDARQKGQVASSREVNHWFMILAGTIGVMFVFPGMMTEFSVIFLRFLDHPHLIPMDFSGLRAIMAEVLSAVAFSLLPLIVFLVMAALASGLVQDGLILAPDRLQPKLEKISPLKGVKRLFSTQSITEFLKGVFKIAIVAAVAVAVVAPELTGLDQLTSFETLQWLGVLHGLSIRMLIGVLAIVSLIAVIDFLYQKHQHVKQMKMSRQDIKDEMKQSEGDPQVRGRLRQIRRERAQKRMMAAVPEASVVIANPTHFAVALKYELDEMPAPVCVAKGADNVALRIREVAEENGVPVMENPPLAQALYAGVEIGEDIPPEHFKAVAEIIGYVLRLKGKLPQQPRAGSS
jgi:flagellar biosynthetic protein FlhB